MSEKYGVFSDFNMEQHKKTFIHYLEVMIDADGMVYYAVPSHQEWAISRACEKLGVSREELSAMTPKEFYFDWLTWLLLQTGSMAVWERGYVCDRPTKKQVSALRKLKFNGLYCGPMPKLCKEG